MALSGLMIAGAVISASNGSDSGHMIGAATSAAGAMGTVVFSVNDELNRLNVSKRVPSTHLFHQNFSVPAEMFVRKWILVNVPGDKWANSVYLTVNTIDGRSDVYEIPIIKKGELL